MQIIKNAQDERAIRKSKWFRKACDICAESQELILLGRREYVWPTRNFRFEMIFQDTLCSHCGFVFESQVPEAGFLDDFYRDSYAVLTNQEIAPDFDSDARLRVLRQYVPGRARVLELGANTGLFCKMMQDAGYQAMGVDPLESSVSSNVLSNIPNGSKFDAIVSYYVLEHVPSAVEWLEHAKQYLSPQGYLIIEVPNFEKFPVESLNHEHLLHFTPFHLSRLLTTHGFEIAEIRETGTSRFFGFLVVARLSSRAKDYAANDSLVDRVQSAKKIYSEAMCAKENEARRLRAFAAQLGSEIRGLAKTREVRVIFFAANELATSIAIELEKVDKFNPEVCDNSRQKQGSFHAGFSSVIIAPDFTDMRCHYSFVLCSQAWNRDIRKQVESFKLPAYSIADAVTWKDQER